MTRFSASRTSEATVAHPRALVWDVLTDPGTVARLTPMVRSITASGDRWRWQLARIPVLGQTFELAFTEQMAFEPEARITFSHAPEGKERAGTDGRYNLADDDETSTHLRIELAVIVDLPFPGITRPAVQASMHGVLAAMGAGFAHSMDKELRAGAA